MIDHARQCFPDLRIPVVDGEFKLVYEPDPEHPNSWMVNDHSLIRDESGNIHFFGIENPFPSTTQALEWLKDSLVPSEQPFIKTLHGLMHGHLYRPGTHFRVGHAVAHDIGGPWRKLPAALDGGEQRRGHGSPFVIRHAGQYWMFEPSDGTGIYTSGNLTDWTPVMDGTLWEDSGVFGPSGHRDPCIVQISRDMFFQYFAAADARGRHTIGLASSPDLKHWRGEEPCYVEVLRRMRLRRSAYSSPRS